MLCAFLASWHPSMLSHMKSELVVSWVKRAQALESNKSGSGLGLSDLKQVTSPPEASSVKMRLPLEIKGMTKY